MTMEEDIGDKPWNCSKKKKKMNEVPIKVEQKIMRILVVFIAKEFKLLSLNGLAYWNRFTMHTICSRSHGVKDIVFSASCHVKAMQPWKNLTVHWLYFMSPMHLLLCLFFACVSVLCQPTSVAWPPCTEGQKCTNIVSSRGYSSSVAGFCVNGVCDTNVKCGGCEQKAINGRCCGKGIMNASGTIVTFSNVSVGNVSLKDLGSIVVTDCVIAVLTVNVHKRVIAKRIRNVVLRVREVFVTGLICILLVHLVLIMCEPS
ncbi:uncharacterized protein BX664DRAFT_316126 [Halteromyces radiatus]|uniref:uncharacterized protein n=1 Tax=Halteromyces radiatus TaxID=101107 RepID=UPI00221F21A6|nr:uncharacterized protein BX664DRAFT_316126 [Halteromyces radiatus]KAI8084579.1 hypothetical protein BX664DRAFT_316126 [Halteromyces radiatus]